MTNVTTKLTQKGNLKRHKSTHTVKENGQVVHNCVHCKKTFKLKKHLKQHLRTHLKTEEPNCPKSVNHFNCIVCDKSFSNRQNLNRHIKLVHAQTKMEKSAGFAIFADIELKEKKVYKFDCYLCTY